MARLRAKDLTAAIRAPFRRLIGDSAANTVNRPTVDFAFDNTYEARWRNSAGTDDIRGISVNASDQLMVGESLATSARKTVIWQMADNASISSQGFFLVNTGESYRVTGISWVHTTKSSVGGTAYVEKTPSGTSIGSGTSLMNGTFDLTSANSTVIDATLAATNTGDSDSADLILNAGDQLSVVIAGTITSLVDVSLTVTLAPISLSVKHASYYMNANADLVQAQYFFTANRPYIVTGVSLRYSTLSSVSGLKLTVTKDVSTDAPGAGTSLLTDNTNAGPLVTQAADTSYAGTLTATAATLRLATGDRLAIKFSGATLTALVGLVVTVSLQELSSDRIEKVFFLDHVVGAADLTGIAAVNLMVADRDYEILDIREVHGTAGNDAGAVNLGVGIATGTTAAASATIIQTDNSSKGFDLKGVAATVQVGTLAVLGNRFLTTGDRLCIVPAGVFTTAVGAQITVALAPR